MSTRKLSGLAVLTMLAVACTAGASQGGTPTTDLFAPTPTIGDPTTSTTIDPRTTAPDIERALLIKVDRFLIPDPGYPGIPMGDWWGGTTSPNRQWLIAQVGRDNGSGEIRLVDIPNWRLAGSWPYGWVQGQAITNDGTGYLVEAVDYAGKDTPAPLLLRVQPGHEGPEVVTELPQGFSTWGQTHVDTGGRVLILGFTPDDPELGGGPATLVVFDPTSEALTETAIPSTQIGTVGQVDTGGQYAGYVLVVPAVIWDDQRSRVLLVDGDDLMITEVDVDSGHLRQHPYTVAGWSEQPLSGGAIASAALSPNGTRLYVARSESSYQVDETSWSRSTVPMGVATIDTESWRVINQLDGGVSTLALSPDGRHLLGWGGEEVESESGYKMTSEPTIDIDPDTFNIRFQIQPPDDGSVSAFLSFDPSSTIGYVSWWDSIEHVNAIQLETGQVMSSREGTLLQVMGGSGLMGVSR